MSDFKSDYRAKLESSLSCPKCKATNRPGATVIELDQLGHRANCSVCSDEGPMVKFLPKAHLA